MTQLFSAWSFVFLWCIPAGFVVGFFNTMLFNHIPARWLCDYDEEPAPHLFDKRLFYRTDGILLGILFSVIFLLFCLQYQAPSCSFFLLAVASVPIVLAAVSDRKYQIIPDQCLPAAAVPAIALFLCCITGKSNFYVSAASPFLGALAGGCIWMLLGLLGRFLFHKESVGFGDVKLFAVIGFLCGFPEVIFIFFLTVLLSGIHFSILILQHKIDAKKYMPMGPYICAACLIALAFRSQTAAGIQWYLSML